ncbi:MAG: MFS transporter [Ilumatobacteraceae bacterium]
MGRGGRMVTRAWPDHPEVVEVLRRPRHDLVAERRVDQGDADDADGADESVDGAEFEQAHGPFRRYRRTVERDGDGWRETTEYRLVIPWMMWLFAIPVRLHLARGTRSRSTGFRTSGTPWWAPPDRLDERQVLVLGLLAAASMSAAFINTVFTQTVAFAADDFGIGSSGIGVAGSVVRAGIVVALPAAVLADRIGRKRVITFVAWAAPILTAVGALAPSFALLVVTQAIGRPIGLALAFLVAVVAAEEVPRSSRAYAVSVLAMASGLGAGLAVLSLPLADLDSGGWRLVFLVTLVWLPVAVHIGRSLPETIRFEQRPVEPPRLDRRRFTILAIVAIAGNTFVAPASFFQNAYLLDVREYTGASIAVFSVATATPAAIGLILGGRFADVRGRRRLLAVALPVSTAFIVVSYSVPGPPMWATALLGGFFGSVAYPALAVYRSELFPTGNRGRVAGLLTATALLGGIGGLLGAGSLLDGSWSYGRVMGLLAIGQLIVAITVLAAYPETAHRELEELNPTDARPR